MKSSDYIIDYLVKKGVDHIFGFQGTMIAHFVDSVWKNSGLTNHSCYNEQGAGFAAVGYAKASGRTAVAYSTSGPGAANLVSAIADAYYDSAPVVFFTGQLNTYEYFDIDGLRQNGFQEMDVISMVKGVTKYCVQITDVNDLRYCLEKAFYLAEHGRPGPVVIDLPMDMQRQEIDPDRMRSFEEPEEPDYSKKAAAAAKDILKRLNSAERPVLMVGNGVEYGSDTHRKVLQIASKLRLPVITSMLARDLMPYEHELNLGHIGGGYGHRYANVIANKKADLIVSLGCSLCKRQTTTKTENFATAAEIVRVEIDPKELERKIHDDDIGYCLDCRPVIDELLRMTGDDDKRHDGWLEVCQEIKRRLTEFDDSCEERGANRMIEELSKQLDENAVICCDVGQHQVWTSQSFRIKEGQQLLFSGGHGAMGFALPAAIGAYYATGAKPVAVCGDGAFQMNIQELQWVFREKIPVTMIVMNNDSLGLIRQQQDDMLDGLYAGSLEEGGFSSPDFCRIAEAYGIEAVRVGDAGDLEKCGKYMNYDRPVLIEVIVDRFLGAYPKTHFGEEMHNQRPYMPEELMADIMEL